MPAKAKATPTKAKKPSSVQDFKKKARTTTELDLPSGAAILAKGVSGMGVFLKSGIIPNSLLSIIQEAIDKGVEPDMDKLLRPRRMVRLRQKPSPTCLPSSTTSP